MAVSAASNKTKLFISYSRKDRGSIDQLSQALDQEEEFNVFRDTDDILPTEEWKPRLAELIKNSDTIIFCLSPNSAVSEVCAWEIELAESLNKRIIPIVIEDVDGNVPEAISKFNYIFLTEKENFNAVFPQIQNAISLDIVWVREHTRLAELAERWEKATRLGAQPLHGKELEQAEFWIANQPKGAPPPTNFHRQYILASRKVATRRQRIMMISSLVALVVVGGLAILVWQQRNLALEQKEIAQINESKALIEKASQAVEISDYASAIRYAYAALPHDDNLSERPILPQAEKILRESISRNHLKLEIPPSDTTDLNAYSEFKSYSQGLYAVRSFRGIDVFNVKNQYVPTHISAHLWEDAKSKPCLIDNKYLVVNLHKPRDDALLPENYFEFEGPGILIVNLETGQTKNIPAQEEIDLLGCMAQKNRIIVVSKGDFSVIEIQPKLFKVDEKLNEFYWIKKQIRESSKENEVPEWLRESFDYEHEEALHIPISPDSRVSKVYGKSPSYQDKEFIKKILIPSEDSNFVVFGVGSNEFCKLTLVDHDLSCIHTSADFRYLDENIIDGDSKVIDLINTRVTSIDTGEDHALPFKTINRDLVPTIKFMGSEFTIGSIGQDINIVDLKNLNVVKNIKNETLNEDISMSRGVVFHIAFSEKGGWLILTVGDKLLAFDASNGFEKIWLKEFEQEDRIGKVFFSTSGDKFYIPKSGGQYLEVRDSKSASLISRFFVGDNSEAKRKRSHFALTPNSNELGSLSTNGVFKLFDVMPRGAKHPVKVTNNSIETAVYANDLGAFVYSTFDGIGLSEERRELTVKNFDVFNDEVTKRLTKAFAAYRPKHNIEPLSKNDHERNSGSAWLKSLSIPSTSNESGVISYSSQAGPAYIWRERDGEFIGFPFEYGQQTLDNNKYEPHILPYIKSQAVNPRGSHIAMLVSGGEVCIYAVRDQSLVFCNDEQKYFEMSWLNDNSIILHPSGGRKTKDVVLLKMNLDQSVEELSRINKKENQALIHLTGEYFLDYKVKDRYFYFVQQMAIKHLNANISIQLPTDKEFSLDYQQIGYLRDASLLVQGDYLLLPIELDRLNNVVSVKQVVFSSISTGKVSCLFPYTNTRYRNNSNTIIQIIPNTNHAIIGENASLLDIETCTVLEVLNNSNIPAAGVAIIDEKVKIILNNGITYEREIHPHLSKVVNEAGKFIKNVKSLN